MATVQSIAFQTPRTARTAAEFREAFEARLPALSEAPDLLTRETWDGASLLRALFDSEVEASGGGGRAPRRAPATTRLRVPAARKWICRRTGRRC